MSPPVPVLSRPEAQVMFRRLRTCRGTVSTDELDRVWAALDVLALDEVLGSWSGSEFDTGHRFNGTLQSIGWHGKSFVSQWDVKPLVCRDDEGELYSNVVLGKGEASLHVVQFRGECTATMVYDGQPVLDHFKKVDEDTVMGIMNGKHVLDGGKHYYFMLDREL